VNDVSQGAVSRRKVQNSQALQSYILVRPLILDPVHQRRMRWIPNLPAASL
jgi:hypothetical protein